MATGIKYPDDEQGRREIDDDANERDNGFGGKWHSDLTLEWCEHDQVA